MTTNYNVGEEMHALGVRLFPINRSLTGEGVRETLSILKEHLPNLSIKSIPSNTEVFDWQVPKEWNLKEAYVLDSKGNRVIDSRNSNLHVVGYSLPINKTVTRSELMEHLHSLPDQPEAIPYVTSYYSEYWGFCVSEQQKKQLTDDAYRVVIESTFKDGVLNFGELIIPGETSEEVFLSTYVCHPSMANNELSGPLVTTWIAKWIQTLSNRKYTYRIIFIPETIGSISYLSQNLEQMKKHVVAGFNVTCIGDDRTYSFLPSRDGTTLSDKAAKHVLKHIYPNYKMYSWVDRGSDERQYCAPGVDLPIATIMRSKYGEYPEYHTSLDDFNLVTPSGLEGGFDALQAAIKIVELNYNPKVKVLCEPQLGKRGLYPTLSTKTSGDSVRLMMNVISYCDGSMSILDIADLLSVTFDEVYEVCCSLSDKKLIERANES